MALEIKKQIIQNHSVERFPKNLAIIQNIESIKFDLSQDLQEKIEDQRIQKYVQKKFLAIKSQNAPLLSISLSEYPLEFLQIRHGVRQETEF